jgi:heme exporter protein D
LLAAVVMVINGILSHRQYVRDHAKHQAEKAAKMTGKQEG